MRCFVCRSAMWKQWQVTYRDVALYFAGNAYFMGSAVCCSMWKDKLHTYCTLFHGQGIFHGVYVGAWECEDRSHTEVLHFISWAMYITWVYCVLEHVKAYLDSKVHGAHLGSVGPRWAPCWPHEPCYQGRQVTLQRCYTLFISNAYSMGCSVC